MTQAELDILLDIEEAVAARALAQNAESETSPIEAWPLESWRDLIEKSVASAALAASGYTGPTREEALDESRPLFNLSRSFQIGAHDLRDGRVSLAAAIHGGLVAHYKPLPQEARALLRLELQRIEIITGEPVHFADPVRLAGRLLSAGLHDGPARRTIDALAAGGLTLAPALMPGHAGACYAA